MMRTTPLPTSSASIGQPRSDVEPVATLSSRWTRAAAVSALFGALALASSPAAAQGKATRDSWYVLTITEDEREFRMTHLWSDGRKFRSETVVSGHPVVTIVNGSTYYTLDLVTGKGVAIERSPAALAADAKGGRPFANDLPTLLATGGEKVGPDEEGRACDVYRRTNDAGRVSMCMSRDDPPLPLYVDIYDRATSHKERVRYLEWQRGLAITGGFFEPPAGLDLERIDYQAYRKRSKYEPIGPVPPLFSDLLHGTPK